ncbi:class I SAM-dependent methyltransferase [Polymorphospora sp. NPDC050346]|uniref:class I SAM-dependent methyltransferase n=1 Tax=Polymorphospora sp. NPDC050346 TaxID=3155780 RepID=UPI0033FF988D
MSEPVADVVARGYDRVAQAYAGLEDGVEWPRLRRLRELLARLPDGSRVLDLGCGNGVPATAEIAKRHVAVGVDVSPRQIELARQNVPDATLSVGDVLELRYEPGSFDAIVAFYTFDHIPRERLPEMLGLMRGWLADGGWALFTVEAEEQVDMVAKWLGEPMFFSSYDAETSRRLVAEAGFEIVDAEVEEQLEGGHPVSYLWITARRREEER